METLIHILVISDDKPFTDRLSNLVNHSQVVVERSSAIPSNPYDFYVVGESIKITDAVDQIRAVSEGSLIYLAGTVCEKNVPVRKMIKCNIVDCIENDAGMQRFMKKVSSLCKQRAQMHKAASKLDRLKSGDLKYLAKQMQKIESNRFVDFVQNHPLPMVLVDRECDILHANKAMEELIGIKLPGVSVATYWADSNELDKAIFDLKEQGQLLGRKITIKNIHGDLIQMKLYTSLHYDADGEWLNTRCLFVPIDLE